MPLSFASAVGNLFNRIGSWGALVANVRTHQLAQLTAMIDTTSGVVAQYNGEPDIQAEMGDSYIGILAGVEGACQTASQAVQDTINRMVFRDNPRINQTLTGVNLSDSIKEVIRQMRVAGASVLAMTITATPSVNPNPGGGSFTGAGNGIIVASVRRPLDGLVLENSFAETVLFTCTSDSYVGGATAGNEGFTVTGVGQQTDKFAFNWPLGSNGSITINAIDGNVDVGSGNLLTNSGFTDWTANIPDNWELIEGTAGTNIAQETTIVYDNTGSSLAFIGDGSTETEIAQTFDDTDGTTGTLDPLTQYAVNVFVRRDGTAAAAGVMSIELTDDSGTPINDENGSANVFTIDLTNLTTVFTSYSGVFRTPLVMPSVYQIRFRMSTALTNGRRVYFDKAAQGLMSQLYTSGPYFACFSGSVLFESGDFGTCTITNSRGVGGTLSTFQTLVDQFLGMRELDFLLPSSAVPTISDALIA